MSQLMWYDAGIFFRIVPIPIANDIGTIKHAIFFFTSLLFFL